MQATTRALAAGATLVAAVAGCGGGAPLPGVVESWEYELLVDSDSGLSVGDPPVVGGAANTLSILWVPEGCPQQVGVDFSGTEIDDLRIVITPERTDECLAAAMESVLHVRTTQPTPLRAKNVEVVIAEPK